MRLQIGRLDRNARNLLLAAASVTDATLDLLAAVTSTPVERIVELLGEAEAKGVIVIDGNLVRFAHPLLAQSFTPTRVRRSAVRCTGRWRNRWCCPN